MIPIENKMGHFHNLIKIIFLKTFYYYKAPSKLEHPGPPLNQAIKGTFDYSNGYLT